MVKVNERNECIKPELLLYYHPYQLTIYHNHNVILSFYLKRGEDVGDCFRFVQSSLKSRC